MFLNSLRLRRKVDAERVSFAARIVIDRATDFSTQWEFLADHKPESADPSVSLNIGEDHQRSLYKKLRELKRIATTLSRHVAVSKLPAKSDSPTKFRSLTSNLPCRGEEKHAGTKANRRVQPGSVDNVSVSCSSLAGDSPISAKRRRLNDTESGPIKAHLKPAEPSSSTDSLACSRSSTCGDSAAESGSTPSKSSSTVRLKSHTCENFTLFRGTRVIARVFQTSSFRQASILKVYKRGEEVLVNVETRDAKKKEIHDVKLYDLAVEFSTNQSEEIQVGTCVVCKYRLLDTVNAERRATGDYYYAVVVQTPTTSNKNRFLLVFDNGTVQYSARPDLNRVLLQRERSLDTSLGRIVHDFLDFQLFSPNRVMVPVGGSQKYRTMEVMFESRWHTATLEEVDCELIRVSYSDVCGKSEWLHRASMRIRSNYAKVHGDVRVIDLVEDTSFGKSIAARIKASQEKKSPNAKHVCTNQCLQGYEDPVQMRVFIVEVGLLGVPLCCGWLRVGPGGKRVSYAAPCGRWLNSIEQVDDFLMKANSKLTIDMFSFSPSVNPLRKFMAASGELFEMDITKGSEPMPISLVNAHENAPPCDLSYVAKRFFSREFEDNNRICFATSKMPDGSRRFERDGNGKLFFDCDFLTCCDCTDNCRNKDLCACQQLTIAESKFFKTDGKKDSNVGYNYKRVESMISTGIYECNSRCSCSQKCGNRIVQKGVKLRLQLFRTDGKGWGVRCLDDIPKGTFVCAYNGEILSPDSANERGIRSGDEYLANLNYIDWVESQKRGFEIDIPSETIELLQNAISCDDENTEATSNGVKSTATAESGITSHDTQVAAPDVCDGAAQLESSKLCCDDGKSGQNLNETTTLKSDADVRAENGDGIDADCDEPYDEAFAQEVCALTDLCPTFDNELRTIVSLTLELKSLHEELDVSFKPYRAALAANSVLQQIATDASTKPTASASTQRSMNKHVAKAEQVSEWATNMRAAGIDCTRLQFGETSPYVIDCKRVGNIGRYLNHSCSPNLAIQNVFYDTHDLRFPHIALFTTQIVTAGTELTWDYGYKEGSAKGRRINCYCGTKKCRKRLL